MIISNPTFRVISRIDIKDDNLVKGVKLEGLRVIGKPNDYARYFYNEGIDEIFYQDVIASLLGRNNLKEIIHEISKDIFIPITVGGGIRTLSDIEQIFRSGADRVAINSGALENINFIKNSIKNFGSSNIVFNVELINFNNSFKVVKYNGREKTIYKFSEWLKILEDNGASEIFVTSVDNDGTYNGIDFRIIQEAIDNSKLSIIYHGGVSDNLQDFLKINQFKRLSGLAISSLFHYEYFLKQNMLKKNYTSGNIDFLKKKTLPKNIKTMRINKFKTLLKQNNILCR